VSNAPFYAAVAEPNLGEDIHHLNTHEYLSVRPFLLGMSITSLCNLLGSNPAQQRSLIYFDSSLNQPLLAELILD